MECKASHFACWCPVWTILALPENKAIRHCCYCCAHVCAIKDPTSRTIEDEKHLVSECPALQDLRDKRSHLFADAMALFIWQDDMVGVVRFIDECLERILYISDQPRADSGLRWLEKI